MEAATASSDVYKRQDYTRCTGIWQTVWLEHLPDSHLKSFRFYPDVENQSVGIEAELTGNEILSVEVSYEGKTVGQAQVKGEPVVHLTVPLTERHLWKVGHGRLYDVKFIYGKDQVQSYFGLRSVRLDGLKFLLNGKSIFLRMVLDQGYYRDGIYTCLLYTSFCADRDAAHLHEKRGQSPYREKRRQGQLFGVQKLSLIHIST